jgi:hypothetical protein
VRQALAHRRDQQREHDFVLSGEHDAAATVAGGNVDQGAVVPQEIHIVDSKARGPCGRGYDKG